MAQIIEFVGCAGVGKSSIFQDFSFYSVKYKKSRLIKLGSNFPLPFLLGSSNRKLHSFVKRVSRKDNLSISRVKHLQRMIVRASLFYSFCSRKENSCLWVFDELYCQGSISLAARTSEPEENLLGFLERSPLPKFLVHVDAPTEVIVSRIKNRKDKVLCRHRGKTDEQLWSVVERGRSLSCLVAEYCELQSVTVIKINSAMNQGYNSRKVLGQLGCNLCAFDGSW